MVMAIITGIVNTGMVTVMATVMGTATVRGITVPIKRPTNPLAVWYGMRLSHRLPRFSE